MKHLNLFLAGAAVMIAGPALAQAPAPAPEAAAPAAPAAPAPATEAEVGQFTTALVAVNEIQKDAALSAEDKQKAMVAKVQESGLDPLRFNELAQAMQSSDGEFQKKVQAELAKRQTAPAG